MCSYVHWGDAMRLGFMNQSYCYFHLFIISLYILWFYDFLWFSMISFRTSWQLRIYHLSESKLPISNHKEFWCCLLYSTPNPKRVDGYKGWVVYVWICMVVVHYRSWWYWVEEYDNWSKKAGWYIQGEQRRDYLIDRKTFSHFQFL